MHINFETWKKQVDQIIVATLGLSSDDLPDWDYQSAYNHNVSPKDAARRAIRAAKNF